MQGALCFSWLESWEHISDIKLFARKIENVFHMVRFHTRALFSFDFSSTFSNPRCLCITMHILIFPLGASRKVKRVLAFSQMFKLDKAIMEQNTTWCDLTQWCFFLFSLKLSQVPAGYALCCSFSMLRCAQ